MIPRIAVLSAAAVCAVCAFGGCSFAVELSPYATGECPSGTKMCEQRCVRTDDPATGCNQPGCGACFIKNAIAKCGSDGNCKVAACTGSYENCNLRDDDGCEVNLATDTEHCGSCTKVCDLPNAAPTCASKVCAVLSCEPGFANCDQNAKNGCEVQLATQAEHCGVCENGCAADQTCISGTCG